jgi:hypothetical protein
MVKLSIDCTSKEFEEMKADLINKFDNKVKLKFKENIAEIRFVGNGLFDNSEVTIYNYINDKYEISKVIILSRSFKDIHNVVGTKEFKENLKDIEEAIKPFYIHKEENWWIGIEDISPDNFNIKDTIKEIYKIGLSCGFIPTVLE